MPLALSSVTGEHGHMKKAKLFLDGARAILFDMDGVLIDSEPVHEQSIIALSAELGEPITSKEILDSFKGSPEAVMARRLKEIYPRSEFAPEQIIQRKVDLYAGLSPQVHLLPGIQDFLRQARARGLRLAPPPPPRVPRRSSASAATGSRRGSRWS